MKYSDFEAIITHPRMGRYLVASGGDTRKAMTLYRKNLRLSQELFTVISCLEIALRNAIDKNYTHRLGPEWLKDAIQSGGIFDSKRCRLTQANINDAIRSLNHSYTHYKLIAEMGFGFWRFMFANNQFMAAGSSLLQIVPFRPKSSPQLLYNHNYMLNHLASINELRNRIAHHEPICFQQNSSIKDTTFARLHYIHIIDFFSWMGIESGALLFGLDHVITTCNDIDNL